MPTWGHSVARTVHDKEHRSRFLQDLDADSHHSSSGGGGGGALAYEGDFRSWSDFLRVHLHPRSLHVVREYMHEDDSRPFESFVQGEQVFSSKMRDDFENSLHFFVEECDHFQGFQVRVDFFF